MRLLNKHTKEFEWFAEPPHNGYYILSHRWRGAETTMQSFMQTRHLPLDQLPPGDAKIHRFCGLVSCEDRPLDFVWIDTCCIDKTSSAELQEAINSMYGWYERAAECVVYLDDVDELEGTTTTTTTTTRLFKDSEWFSRGWCLQELLAPLHQRFLNSRWEHLGYRSELGDQIEEITGIGKAYLGDPAKVRSALVAERMAWMGLRKTTRGEDRAYAMLGIFDINMTMLYGEGGEKAFLRLQKKIIHSTNDESIFVWRTKPEVYQKQASGLLAPHPECFQFSFISKLKLDNFFERAPYRMTNKGIEIQKYDQVMKKFSKTDNLYLNCMFGDLRVGIQLTNYGKNEWVRSDCSVLMSFHPKDILSPPTELEVQQKLEQERRVAGRRLVLGGPAPELSRGRYNIYVRQINLQQAAHAD